MSDRWVIPWLFRAQVAQVDWRREIERLGYDGTVLQTGVDAPPVQLRWMLHPRLGLPLQPFTVFRNRRPPGSLSTQELADLPGWELVEIVGLPVDGSWAASGYALGDQGPVQSRLPPVEAAAARLKAGAPRIGWTGLTVGGASLDPWESAQLDPYLKDLLQGRLLRGIKTMLTAQPDPLAHAAFVDAEEEPAGVSRLQPRVLAIGPGAPAPTAAALPSPSRAEWHPLGLLAVGIGTDPLASLALGFGTALSAKEEEILMVSVRHRIIVANQTFDFEVADVADPNAGQAVPDPPTGLLADLLHHDRAQVLDGPGAESVGINWDRPPNPFFSAQPPTVGRPCGYAVGRLGPQGAQGEILLTPRPDGVGGWVPFAASRPDSQDRPITFADHLPRFTTVNNQALPDPLPAECTYAVAAEDIFGRFTAWRTASYVGKGEPPKAPDVISVRLDSDGAVTVDFSWDWSDRSPEFMELAGAFADDPRTLLLSTNLQFRGQPAPQNGPFPVVPLDSNRAVVAAFGAAQDRDPAEPGLRLYRLTVTVPLSFGGQPQRRFEVRARGQCHTHNLLIPGFNESPFGPPVATTVFDPVPPPPPVLPEAPQWASLPDVAGVSRAVLTWQTDPSVRGYALYEATETSLLAALGLPGPDTSQPFADRLAVLRAANLPAQRSIFRRVREALIPPGLPVGLNTPDTTFEIALPRGSAVMHLYAVTAVSPNQVESAWPIESKNFIAVAVPHLAVPSAPVLGAEPDTTAPSTVNLSVGVRAGPAARQVELYRISSDGLSSNVDTMGPPMAVLNVTGPELSFTDTTATSGWRRIWYRAVAWSADDLLLGLVGARSPASAAVSVFLPPQTLPDIRDLRVNEPGSTAAECLVSWASSAPLPVTLVGPHTAVLESRGATGTVTAHLPKNGRLDALPFFGSLAALPTANPADRQISRVSAPGTPPYRFYAWLPRPAADQSFNVTAKMIDPLGRIASLQATVPPLPVLPLLALTFERTHVPQGQQTVGTLTLSGAIGGSVQVSVTATDSNANDVGVNPSNVTLSPASSTAAIVVFTGGLNLRTRVDVRAILLDGTASADATLLIVP